jgi:hypothetical protein
MTNSRNPFNKEETIQSWLNSDQEYLNSKQQSLFDFQQKYNLNNNFNNIFITTKQFIQNLFKKHALVTYVITFLLVATVAGVTAETIAPEEFKPSTKIKNLFAANTQSDKDPYTALKPDDKNHVVTLEKCNLGVKYPQKIAEKDMISWDTDSFLGLDEKPLQKDFYSYIIERIDKSEEKQENGEMLRYRLEISCSLEDIKINPVDKAKYIAESLMTGLKPISIKELRERKLAGLLLNLI